VTDKRELTQYLKEKFIEWRDPPIELPAESVIDDVVSFIYDEALKNAKEIDNNGS